MSSILNTMHFSDNIKYNINKFRKIKYRYNISLEQYLNNKKLRNRMKSFLYETKKIETINLLRSIESVLNEIIIKWKENGFD